METTHHHGSGNAAPYFPPINLAISDVSAFMPQKKRTVCHLSLLFFFKKIPSKILEASAQYP